MKKINESEKKSALAKEKPVSEKAASEQAADEKNSAANAQVKKPSTKKLLIDLVEYPYQIWYKDEEYGEPHLLTNTNNLFNVTYQNSTQKVDYVPVYTPPNSTVSYESVYFLHPSKNAEIHFPSDTIEYRIIECGVNSEVYDVVRVNGTEVDGTSIGNTNRNYYDSGWLSVSERPNIVFENHVDEDALRTLSIQKMLYDENGNFLSAENDGTTFNFRLYISNGVDDTLTLANMYKYFVKDPEGYYCEWNSTTKTFVPTEKRSYSLLTDAEKESLSFDTSMNGAISKIPSGYTVEVPNLPVGTRFKVEERDYEIPLGYKLENYEREAATYRSEDGDTLNSGWVRANESPKMYVNNKRGWEIQVNKSWSDKDYVSSHESIFTAIYDGNDLVTGTVRQIKHPDTSLRYFFDTLPQGASFENYTVYEVELESPVFDSNGDLLSYSAVHRRLNEGDLTTIDAVPKNSDTSETFSYAATYNRGEVSATAESVAGSGNIRTDTITNTRTGGLVITLYDMNTREPLVNGVFTLTKGDTQIGTFTSDKFGRVTILYDFERESDYVLTETSPPSTYIGLPNSAVFSIGANDSIYISGNESQWESGHKSEKEGDQLIAYIDIFNKPFTLRAVKVDGGTDAALGGAHFALYRSVSGIGGAVKDVSPLVGYEDLVSGDDGVIPRIDNTLTPGKYYLTEISAPSNYEGLDEDIVFTITSTGDVIINSAGHSGYLSTSSGNEIDYVMSIPNTKTDTDAVLSITKTVEGNFGDKNKEFTFTLAVSGAQAEDEYEWTKNGVEQTVKLHGNSTFTLKHGDTVEITLPQDVNITLTESNENYVASFKLGDETAQTVNTKTFMLSEDTALEVTNTLNGIVPTGIYTNFAIMFVLLIPSAVTAFIVIKQWKKRYKNERSK